jgi:hypothetical protein
MVLGSTVSPTLQGRRTGRSIEDWITDEIEQEGQREAQREQEEAIRQENRAWLDTFDLFFGPFIPWLFCWMLALPALILTGATMAMPGGAPAPSGGLHLKRVPWRPRISGLGLLGGLLGGAGLVVMLQQFAVRPLTGDLALEGLICGPLIGLLLPTLTHTLTVIGLNGKIARGERRLSQTMGLTKQASTEAPPTEMQPPAEPPQQAGPQAPEEEPPEEPQA